MKTVIGIDNGTQSTVGVGVSGQQHGFLPLDKNGKILCNVKIWSDTSTVRECSDLEQACGGRGNKLFPLEADSADILNLTVMVSVYKGC